MKYRLSIIFLLCCLLNPHISYSDPVFQQSDTIRINKLIKDSKTEENLNNKLVFLGKALAFSNELQYHKGLYEAHYLIGTLYNALNSFDIALNHFLQSYEYAKTIGDNNLVAKALRGLGKVYFIHNDIPLAYSHFEKALTIRKQIGNEQEIASSINDVAECYRLQGNYKKALEFFYESVVINKELQNKKGLAINYLNIGLCNKSIGEEKIAIDYLDKAGNISDELNDLKLKATVNSGFGEVYYVLKEYDNAIKYLMRAYDQTIVFSLSPTTMNIILSLSKSYKAKGELTKAYEYLEIYDLYKDSLFNAEKHEQMLLIKTQYEEEKKLKEITKLTFRSEIVELELKNKQKIQYISVLVISVLVLVFFITLYSYRTKYQHNLFLKKSLEEKEVLLKEVHHRVKNNFQLISSLLNLQSSKITDESAYLAIEDSRSRINSMALVHQKLYISENLASIDMKEYFGQLLLQIFNSSYSHSSKITYDVNCEGILFDTETAIPVGLIVSELVTNSYKYAFKTRTTGCISVQLNQLNKLTRQVYQLTVSDNGIGLPDNFDFSKLDSLGLELVQVLTEQLEGKLEYETSDKGTSFSIRFMQQ